MNDDLNTWSGGTGKHNQPRRRHQQEAQRAARPGVRRFHSPTPKLNLGASVTWAKVNEKQTIVDDKLGTEFDVTATYKIYDNLSYMVGAGYLLTGDYFKGTSPTRRSATTTCCSTS